MEKEKLKELIENINSMSLFELKAMSYSIAISDEHVSVKNLLFNSVAKRERAEKGFVTDALIEESENVSFD